jgi:hypothetical protein
MRVRLALTVANSAATYRALINTSSVMVRIVINIGFFASLYYRILCSLDYLSLSRVLGFSWYLTVVC